MSGGFFRGTSAEQDTRFSNKTAKLLKTQKFASELDLPIDMSKVNMDVIRPWIATRVTELLGFEDEVLINFIYGLLDVKVGDGKHIQIQLTGFMEKNTGRFMKELWGLLVSAQTNANGIPQVLLDKKAAETQVRKAEEQRIITAIAQTAERDKEAAAAVVQQESKPAAADSSVDPKGASKFSEANRDVDAKNRDTRRRRSVSRSPSSSRSRSRSPGNRRRPYHRRSPPRHRRSRSPPRRRRRPSPPRHRPSRSPARHVNRRHPSRSRSPRRRSPPPNRRRGRSVSSPSRSPPPPKHRRSPARSRSPPRRRHPLPPHRRPRSPPRRRRSPSASPGRRPPKRTRSPKRRSSSPSPSSSRGKSSPSPAREEKQKSKSRTPVRSQSKDESDHDSTRVNGKNHEAQKDVEITHKRTRSPSQEAGAKKLQAVKVDSSSTGEVKKPLAQPNAMDTDSERMETSSPKRSKVEDDDMNSDKRAEKKRRKEEKRLRKDRKREKKRRKEERKSAAAAAAAGSEGNGGKSSSVDGEATESELKRIEDDLRKKALESLKSKKVAS